MAEKISVLMVDDEAQFRETTAKILRKRGFDAAMAESGEAAVEILQKTPKDVVVLDIKMPGIDGHEALSRIKAIRPETQVIMLTGHGAEESAREALQRGAFDYLTKPCDIDLLALKITDAHKHRGGREKAAVTEKQARDIMIHIDDYTTLTGEKTVREAIAKLFSSFAGFISTGRVMETGHRSILVFDKEGDLSGFLSIQDLIRAVRPDYLSAPKPSMADSIHYSALFWSGLFTSRTWELGKKRVGEILSDPAVSVAEDANLMELAHLLHEEGLRRVVVRDKADRVIGVVREQELFFEMANILL